MTNVRPASSKKSLVNYNSLNAKQFLSSLKNLSHLQLGYQAWVRIIRIFNMISLSIFYTYDWYRLFRL